MENRFADSQTPQQSLRSLEPVRLLDKYITAWQCSSCRRHFALKESERLAMGTDVEVPSRIRHSFEAHKCIDCARKDSTSLARVDDIWSA
ncbi:MAG TPA: hypothetical protein VN176_08340 [Verrucomicrobiae bacterium]|nr:hypothetical protein [Verrucomicrobiae bacterium]